MPTSAYIPPQVTFQELVSPSFQPVLDRPTTIALVGEAQNFLTATETLPLIDSTPVELKQTGVDLNTLVIRDALNPLVVYSPSDYVTSVNATSGKTTVARRLYTTIPTGSNLVAVATTTGGSGAAVVSLPLSLDGNGTSSALVPGNGGTVNSVVLQSRGQFNGTRDFNLNVGGSTTTIARKSSGSNVVDGQTLFVSYTTSSGTKQYIGEAVTLSGTTPVHLAHESEAVDSSSVLVFNASPASDTSITNTDPLSVNYAAGATNDYVVSSLPGASFTVTRSASGPTTIGSSNNRGQVRASYQATPVDYYRPTHVFSISDVEARFGSAVDSNGNINSPLSFGALMAFANGAPDFYVVPLFHSVDGTTNGPRSKPTFENRVSYVNDWSSSVQALRDLDDVNVVIPVINHSNIKTLTDGDVLTIFQTIQSHINFQDQNNQFVIGIYGEDSTSSLRAQSSVLQDHAATLGAGLLPERQVLISPGGYSFASPVGGAQVNIGGQYVACAVAGMLNARSIQDPLTRKAIARITDVNDFRTEMDKNSDAQSGLFVVHKKNGVVQVRHALTTAINDPNTRELSVIRAKHFMIESIRQTLDTQIVGQLIADARAPFIVQTTVQGVLESLLSSGAIVGYAGIAARSLAPAYPTVIEVRFSYQPAYPLNYVQVIFSLDLTAAGGGSV